MKTEGSKELIKILGKRKDFIMGKYRQKFSKVTEQANR